MMQEEGGRVTHGKGMAHDHDDGHDSDHDMMDPAHVAHCIGYIAQVSFKIAVTIFWRRVSLQCERCTMPS